MAGKGDNFWGGFFLGTAIGATIGAIVALNWRAAGVEEEGENQETEPKDVARTLEEKIAQLNAAIDAVTEELAHSNRQPLE
ncbi:MAG: hypothetical protein RMK91_06985 [Pseudanabaenaceae cyanobacterium SKYGB_i_bin29]|nr:hypothetical protein [Pseudanabaenaceae cyanobacterium SKYG29]MDW8421597.1 hypothetical protein [Pseudanabaenaceae cyanobacterium SKYGB_i_bin29]